MISINVYAYEYMKEWETFNERSLYEKEEFHSNLNMEDITEADYMHANRVCKNFEIKNLILWWISWYATLLMADFF